jgi:hypothetical protein
MREENDTRTLGVSNENLRGAIEILRAMDRLAWHFSVYATLSVERSRRELLAAPPREIRLTREAFEALPHVIQRLLAAHPF